MTFVNRQFGELEFEEKHVLHFPDGLIGFEDAKKFLIVDDEDSQPFRWLVSLDDEELSFAMVDPDLTVPDYWARSFSGRDATVFLLVALRDPVELSTMNLRSPVVIDNATRSGSQPILDDDSLSMRHPLFSHRTELVEE